MRGAFTKFLTFNNPSLTQLHPIACLDTNSHFTTVHAAADKQFLSYPIGNLFKRYDNIIIPEKGRTMWDVIIEASQATAFKELNAHNVISGTYDIMTKHYPAEDFSSNQSKPDVYQIYQKACFSYKKIKETIVPPRPANRDTLKEPKFKVQNYDMKDELLKFDTLNTDNPFVEFPKIMKNLWKPVNKELQADNMFIWNLIHTPENYTQAFVKHITKETPPNERDAFTALTLRVERFRIKLVSIQLIQSCNPLKYLAIQRKIDNIIEELQKKTLNIAFKPIPPKVNDPQNTTLTFTFMSTIKTFSKVLMEYELKIKELLPGLLQSYNIVHFASGIHFDRVRHALNSIAPPGFKGIEPDYYYIIRLLFPTDLLTIFNAQQLKL